MSSLSSTGGRGGIMRRTTGLPRAGRGVTSKCFSASDGSTPSWRSRATVRQTAERERCRRPAIWVVDATGHRLINSRISSSVHNMAGAMRADRAAKMAALRFSPTAVRPRPGFWWTAGLFSQSRRCSGHSQCLCP